MESIVREVLYPHGYDREWPMKMSGGYSYIVSDPRRWVGVTHETMEQLCVELYMPKPQYSRYAPWCSVHRASFVCLILKRYCSAQYNDKPIASLAACISAATYTTAKQRIDTCSDCIHIIVTKHIHHRLLPFRTVLAAMLLSTRVCPNWTHFTVSDRGTFLGHTGVRMDKKIINNIAKMVNPCSVVSLQSVRSCHCSVF